MHMSNTLEHDLLWKGMLVYLRYRAQETEQSLIQSSKWLEKSRDSRRAYCVQWRCCYLFCSQTPPNGRVSMHQSCIIIYFKYGQGDGWRRRPEMRQQKLAHVRNSHHKILEKNITRFWLSSDVSKMSVSLRRLYIPVGGVKGVPHTMPTVARCIIALLFNEMSSIHRRRANTLIMPLEKAVHVSHDAHSCKVRTKHANIFQIFSAWTWQFCLKMFKDTNGSCLLLKDACRKIRTHIRAKFGAVLSDAESSLQKLKQRLREYKIPCLTI